MLTNFNCGVLYVSNEWEIPEIQSDLMQENEQPSLINEEPMNDGTPMTIGASSAATAAETNANP